MSIFPTGDVKEPDDLDIFPTGYLSESTWCMIYVMVLLPHAEIIAFVSRHGMAHLREGPLFPALPNTPDATLSPG